MANSKLITLAERLERIALNLRSDENHMVFIPNVDEAAAALRDCEALLRECRGWIGEPSSKHSSTYSLTQRIRALLDD